MILSLFISLYAVFVYQGLEIWPLITVTLLSSLLFPHKKDSYYSRILFLFIILLFYPLSERVLALSSFSAGFEREVITVLSGTAIEDGSISLYGKESVLVSATEVNIKSGEVSSARGIIRISYPDRIHIHAGDRALFEGSFSDYGFNAKRVRVKRRGSVNIFRNKVDNFITSHLSSSKEVFSLQCLLLLGRKTEAKSSLSEMARESGTSYLLALSGMHISLFSFLLGFVLAPCLGKKRGRVVSLSLLLVYVIVVGPKPSLVRALLFSTVLFVFPQISAIEALFISLFLQLLFLPESLLELSSVYSYLSLSGILAFGEVLKKNIDRLIYLPLFILNSLAASVSAIVYTVPFSYAVFKSYTFSSIFTGPLAIVVVYLFMVISIISLFVSPLDKVLVKIYDILSLILEKGGTLAPFETLKPYFLLLFCILCLVLLSTILSFIRERKRCGISTIQV